ncbi:hypothetical protein ES707_04127 [subsurface metagenome]
MRTLHYADFVGEIRGGDSFSDIYGLRTFLIGIVPCVIAILMRKDLILLPQTYGPYKSRLAKIFARFVIRRAKQVFSRDNESVELVRDLLGPNGREKDVCVCPDVAFVLDPVLPDKIDIQPTLDRSSCTPLIGLNISSLLYIGGFTRDNMFGLKVEYKEFVHVLVEELMERTNADLLFVPHVFWSASEWDESEVCREVLESVNGQYEKRLHLVTRAYDQNQMKGIIGLCDFFIGSRMHACIAALSQCIPTIGLAYSKKFRGVLETVGAGQFAIDMREKKQEQIIETVISAFERRKAIAKGLKATIPEAQKRVWDVFREMLCETRN